MNISLTGKSGWISSENREDRLAGNQLFIALDGYLDIFGYDDLTEFQHALTDHLGWLQTAGSCHVGRPRCGAFLEAWKVKT